MRRQRFSREQIAEADQRDILGVARELNLKLEKRKIHISTWIWWFVYYTYEECISLFFCRYEQRE